MFIENCIFCKKLKDGSEIIYNNGIFAAQFDRFPVVPGHSELFPLEHKVSIEDINLLEASAVFSSLEDLKKLVNNTDLEKVYRGMIANPLNDISKEMCEHMLTKPYLKEHVVDYNFGCNNGRLSGRTVDHLHFHFIPRHKGDVLDPVGGCRNIIPGMGNYRIWKKTQN